MSNKSKLIWSLVAILIGGLLLSQPYKNTRDFAGGYMRESDTISGTQTTPNYTFITTVGNPIYMTIETSKKALFLNYFALFFPVVFFAQSFWFGKVHKYKVWAKSLLFLEGVIVIISAHSILFLDLFDKSTGWGITMFFLSFIYGIAAIVIVFWKRLFTYLN